MTSILKLTAVVLAAVFVNGGELAPGSRGARIAEAVIDARAADEPFPHLTETRLKVGGTRRRVVVADGSGERSEGMRRRETLGPYDGMLFAYLEPVQISFTMSTVPVPLDIAFYDAKGRFVSRLRMEPCAGSEEDCPVYRADGEFRYALETLAGDLPRGGLRAAA
ncbi:MAG: DUF192 domain-containing protein [Acidimicrobiia bacterium]